jgi:hypothetical protein
MLDNDIKLHTRPNLIVATSQLRFLSKKLTLLLVEMRNIYLRVKILFFHFNKKKFKFSHMRSTKPGQDAKDEISI